MEAFQISLGKDSKLTQNSVLNREKNSYTSETPASDKLLCTF